MVKRYTSNQLTKYAEEIGFVKTKVSYSKTDGWWLETDSIDEYLGADSYGAKSKLTELCANKKATWGGKRVSTKPKKEATKVMRIPISKIEETKKLIGK